MQLKENELIQESMIIKNALDENCFSVKSIKIANKFLTNVTIP